MINKKFIITRDELNTELNIELDLVIPFLKSDATGINVKTVNSYPLQLLIFNETRKDLEINIFEDDKEKDNYINDYIFFPDGSTFTSTGFNLPRAKWLIIRGLTGKTSHFDLRIDAIDYKTTNSN